MRSGELYPSFLGDERKLLGPRHYVMSDTLSFWSSGSIWLSRLGLQFVASTRDSPASSTYLIHFLWCEPRDHLDVLINSACPIITPLSQAR